MKFDENKLWRIIPAAGTILSVIICAINIYKTCTEDYSAVMLASSFYSLVIFVYLNFDCKNYYIYGLFFYIHGLLAMSRGSTLTSSQAIFVAVLLIEKTDFFKSYKNTKKIAGLIPVIVIMFYRFFTIPFLDFMESVYRMLFSVFMLFIIFTLIYPKLKKDQSSTVFLPKEKFTPQEIDILNRVLNGEKYSYLANIYDISESSIKSKMSGLYQKLNAAGKTDFMVLYSGKEFVLSEEEL